MDVAQLLELQQSAPLGAPPMEALGQGLPPIDAAGMMPPASLPPGVGGIAPPMPMPAPFMSTDPGALTAAVQQTLADLAAQDHHLLEMQQQQAAMQAQPMIDGMLAQASAAPPMPGGMGMDPEMAFGEQPGLPPLPPAEMPF